MMKSFKLIFIALLIFIPATQNSLAQDGDILEFLPAILPKGVPAGSLSFYGGLLGGTLDIYGSNLTSATEVSIGGISQDFGVIDDTHIHVPSIALTTPLGSQQVLVTTASGSASGTNIFSRLLINELDADTPGSDMAEFVELYETTGNNPLDGFVLVFWNGANNISYYAIDLSTYTTGANGFFLTGNTAVAGVDLVFADNLLQNGADAVGLFVGSLEDFPNGTAVTGTNLVDAVVYGTGDPDAITLLFTLLGSGPEAVQLDEAGTGASDVTSVQRCSNSSALDGRLFTLGSPSPGLVNSVSSCE